MASPTRSAAVTVCCVLVMFSLASPVGSMSASQRLRLRNEVVEMFDHAYTSYMVHAFPADELMPLTCGGRVRGKTKSRGDIDDALGNFSLTLVDTLDTLVVLGNTTEFYRAVQLVVQQVKFDADFVVSTFETNIRVLGGLLSAHAVLLDLIERSTTQPNFAHDDPYLRRYKGELLTMAVDLGDRLLRAFDTKTGLPWSRINLKHGIDHVVRKNQVTCTACAGTMIMEFAALSRFSGDPKYEVAARRALEALWSRRGTHDLVGTTINITSGQWKHAESGVGAGIDSYYEYLLKAYVMLGEPTYLNVFNKHYSAIMRYLKRGPYLVNIHMNRPASLSRRFMDALQTFWPGLQVLKGDLTPAIETHRMYYHLSEQYGFIPEGFTADFKVNWGNSPLRPEFVESTYFLYKATGDPFYLEVGKSIISSYQQLARVKCGFAAIKDVRHQTHEDKMDSFVLAETFKYLFLLFADAADTPINMDDYIFTTEAHVLPLWLSRVELDLDPFVEFDHDATDTHDHCCLSVDHDLKLFAQLVGLTADLKPPTCAVYNTNINFDSKTAARRATAPRAHNKNPAKVFKKFRPYQLNIEDPEHLGYLAMLGILVDTSGAGVRLIHHADSKHQFYHQGLEFMRELIAVSSDRDKPGAQRSGVDLRIVSPSHLRKTFNTGPASFGPNLDSQDTVYTGAVVTAEPPLACTPLTDCKRHQSKISVVTRGGCMFIEKVRHAEACGAIAVIVLDNKRTSSGDTFMMSGDGNDNVSIPAVFVYAEDVPEFRKIVDTNPHLFVDLHATKWTGGGCEA
eukprot:m.384968 g.384968  ORF g.384968 m.384968 type:complete len:794 (+) comp20050_c6_seq4:476-2857(+)